MPTVGDTVIQARARAPNRRPSSKSDGLQGSSARVAVNQADLEHSLVVVFWFKLGLCATSRQGRALPGIVPGVSELAIVPTPFLCSNANALPVASEPQVCKCAVLPTHPPCIPYLHEPETVLHQCQGNVARAK